MKKVLITGSQGQLGLKIKDNLKYKDDINFIFTDISELDITIFSDVENFVKTNKIDVLINCAAYTSVDLAEEEKEKAFILNSYAPENLARLARIYDFKLIHISTDYVFDGHSNTPYSEEDKTNPMSIYGKSKLEGENMVLVQNSNSIIIRTSWLYSEYGNNFAKTVLKLANEKDFLEVVYDQVGTPTYAGDLANALIEMSALYCTELKWVPGIYNYSNLGVCSWYDFAVKLLKSSEINIKIFPLLSTKNSTKAPRPNYSVLNKSKFNEVYELDIPYWTDSVDKMLENYLNIDV